MKGYMVGNGVTSNYFDGQAYVPFLYGHALMPNTLYEQTVKTCNGSYWNATGDCAALLQQSGNLVSELNIYDIYKSCYGLRSSEDAEKNHDLFYRIRQPVRDSQQETTDLPGGQVPCIDSTVASMWINQASVRNAIHAVSVAQQNWTICSSSINYTTVYDTVIPVHQQLLAAGYQLLIYSGDVDMCIPYTGTEAWTTSLGLPVLQDWAPWRVDFQVAGYVKMYQQLTFVTVKGSGHKTVKVPQPLVPQNGEIVSEFV